MLILTSQKIKMVKYECELIIQYILLSLLTPYSSFFRTVTVSPADTKRHKNCDILLNINKFRGWHFLGSKCLK